MLSGDRWQFDREGRGIGAVADLAGAVENCRPDKDHDHRADQDAENATCTTAAIRHRRLHEVGREGNRDGKNKFPRE